MKRIFYEADVSTPFSLEGDYFHYLKNVVRAKEGDMVGVLTESAFAECRISELGKRNALLTPENCRDAKKHDYRLKVYQCVLKREYMDFAVEKYAEMGATEIVPVFSERSLKELKEKTKSRYSDIVRKAVLQSENEQMPVVHDAADIPDIKADMDENILFYERCTENSVIKPSKSMSIVIGPEGGFTEEEYEMLFEKGFAPVRPIKQILKAETASVVFTGYVRILQESM